MISEVIAIGSGSLLGLLGSVFSKSISLVENWQKAKIKQIDYQHELAILDRQTLIRKEELESEERIAMYSAEAKIRQASYVHDSKLGQASQDIINVLRLVRPVLTVLLLLIVFCVWAFSGDEDYTVRASIIENILFASNVAIAWWFGDRSLNKNIHRD
jgi:hypothetical protein